MIRIGAKRPNEVTCYGFASEAIADPFKRQGLELQVELEVLRQMQEWRGHLGVMPEYPNMVHIYDTRAHAQEAYEKVKEIGVKVGGGVTEVYVDRQYLPEWYVGQEDE